jgi:hypothetical protein
MDPLLQRLMALESEIGYQTDSLPDEDSFQFVSGSLPVLLSAPHGAAHWRKDRYKEEDEYTAGLVRMVAEITGAHVIYAHRRSLSDPNADQNAPYKDALREITRHYHPNILLDIHGCRPENGFGIALGTMKGTSCPRHRPALLQTLHEHGFSTTASGLTGLNVDKKYPAMGVDSREPVTRFAWEKLGLPAAQFEVNAHLRVVQRLPGASTPGLFTGAPDGILHLVATLTALVKAVAAV